MKALFTILINGFLYFSVCLAQNQNGKISGRVFDQINGKTVPLVIVLLYDGDIQTMSSRTNQSGNFSFVALNPGEYSLKIQRNGYLPFSRKIRVNANFTTKIDISVKPVNSDSKPVSSPVSEQSVIVKKETELSIPDSGKLPVQLASNTKSEPLPIQQNKTIDLQTPVVDTEDFVVYPSEEITDNTEFEFFEAVEEQSMPIEGWKAVMKNVVYPQDAFKMNIQGTVYLKAWINEEGEVKILQVQKSIPMLDIAAQDAVYKTKFLPGRIAGDAVASILTIPVAFRISK